MSLASLELRTRASGKDGGLNMFPGCQLHVSAIAVANRRYTTEVLWRRCRLVKDELSPGSANRELAGNRLVGDYSREVGQCLRMSLLLAVYVSLMSFDEHGLHK